MKTYQNADTKCMIYRINAWEILFPTLIHFHWNFFSYFFSFSLPLCTRNHFPLLIKLQKWHYTSLSLCCLLVASMHASWSLMTEIFLLELFFIAYDTPLGLWYFISCEKKIYTSFFSFFFFSRGTHASPFIVHFSSKYVCSVKLEYLFLVKVAFHLRQLLFTLICINCSCNFQIELTIFHPFVDIEFLFFYFIFIDSFEKRPIVDSSK